MIYLSTTLSPPPKLWWYPRHHIIFYWFLSLCISSTWITMIFERASYSTLVFLWCNLRCFLGHCHITSALISQLPKLTFKTLSYMTGFFSYHLNYDGFWDTYLCCCHLSHSVLFSVFSDNLWLISSQPQHCQNGEDPYVVATLMITCERNEML